MNMDAFALLGLSRRAVISVDEVRTAFQKAGAAVHPDHNKTEERSDLSTDFALLTEAHAILSSTPRRLRHLLELVAPGISAAKAGSVLDDRMLGLFTLTAGAVQQAQAVQLRKSKASSSLARAMLAHDEMRAQEALEKALAIIEAERTAFDTVLGGIDALLAVGGDATQVLQSAAARAGFLEKWHQQLRSAYAGFFTAP